MNQSNFYFDNKCIKLKSATISSKLSDKSLNNKSSNNETIRYYDQKVEDLKNDNNSINFITLEDVNQNFSKKLKKKMKKRKKIQKLKELLKLQRLKINKNLIDSFVQQTLKNQNSNFNEILTTANLNNSISSSNNKIISQLMESTTNEEEESIINQNNP